MADIAVIFHWPPPHPTTSGQQQMHWQ
ncbi:GpE family phage tail protein [Cronobacter universalis]|nr:GpE family phage tail protein [Cronobacter universalis]MDI7659397.1 GpE family phage tail protein [Cronobacter universalis]